MAELDPKKARLCPLNGWICKPECAWFYRLDTAHGRCAIVVLIELLRNRR
jgi:hypothetical protein